jgi:predicted metalloprotease
MHSILSLTQNTRFMYLPHELLFHIISFNEKTAVELIQKKAKMMLKNKIKAFERMIIFGFYSQIGFGGSANSLFYNNRIVSREEVVETFSKCDCCERHKINRPKKLAPWVDTDFHDTVIRSCPCHCRQFSRFICREIN